MPNFSVSQSVGIPVEIQPGAFPGEFLVTLLVDHEKLSGFVREEYIERQSNGRGVVRGSIVGITPEEFTVQIPGSFFTTAAGLASIPSQWAKSNLELLAA